LQKLSPWWRPDIHADRRPILLARNRIGAAIRAWFTAHDFTEVECGALQLSPGNETHLHAISAAVIGPDGSTEQLYLHTSPEFASKKLLAAGERRIFDLARVYRNRERTALHAPEFTMLEWYRAHENYQSVMRDSIELLRIAAAAAGADALSYRGKSADPGRQPERLTVAEAFERHAGIALLETVAADGSVDLEALATAARATGVQLAESDSWSDIFSRVMVERIEPRLGEGRATLLYEYPVIEAALARVCPHDPRVAERFELYACGVELANGFGELTDPDEQRRRFEEDMALKAKLYGEHYPIDEDFLAALAIMPEASGVALGFDRLVMLATGASRIDQVLWTPLSAR
jgi:elongation factor P--(R)-beta-lysine ligase